MFEKIMVPLDGSLPSESAIPVAQDLAKHYNSRIELVKITLIPSIYHAIEERALKADLDECRSYLEHKAVTIREAGLEVSVFAGEGAPAVAHALVARATANHADLIVLASHGQGSLERHIERLLLGSIAERVAHHAPLPVLIVRPPRNTTPTP